MPVVFKNSPLGITANKLNKAFSAIGPGTGDMTKAVYDANNDGIVDHAALADTAPWGGITGKPTLPDPGTWTILPLAAGWTAPIQAQYRVQVIGSVSTVFYRGMIQAAFSSLGIPAFTVPANGRPSMTRSAVLGGAQSTGTPSDIASYLASITASGVCTLYFLVGASFVWADPSKTQQVNLDGLFYSL